MKKPLACSFCGKPDRQVQRLIAGPRVFICDACVEVCNTILAEHEPPAASASSRDQLPPRTTPWWRRFVGWLRSTEAVA